MHINRANIRGEKGFTLVEIAIVMVIVALLIGGMLMPISAQVDLHNMRETQKDLDNIKSALIGFALSHPATTNGKPYLPCPDTDGDGAENRTDSACSSAEGDVPWADLGVSQRDSWDRTYRYRVTAAFSNSANGFLLTSSGDIDILQAAGGSLLANNAPVVFYSRGKNGASGGTDEAENADGDAEFVSHGGTITTGNAFDDMVVWVPTTILFYEMVSAGLLP